MQEKMLATRRMRNHLKARSRRKKQLGILRMIFILMATEFSIFAEGACTARLQGHDKVYVSTMEPLWSIRRQYSGPDGKSQLWSL